MPKQSYYEGWGYSDTIKLLLKGSEANRNSLFKELKSQFPKEDIEKSGSQIIEAFVYEKQIPTVKKMARIFNMKVMYEGGGNTDDIEIAKIILQQLGGQGRLVVMTGAYNFVALRNGVSFKIKNRSVNYVEIKLNGKDLYDVKFGRISVGKLKVKSEHNDVYFDELIPLFEKETGMYLRLFKKGGFVSTQNRDMVLGQLKSIHHHEEELKNALKTSGEIEAWVLAKVQRATTDLSDVTHYIDGRKEFAKGGLVEKYVRAYSYDYADEDGQYEVKVQFFDSQDENSDYIDEESIFVKTRKEAEDLEDEINNFGYKKGYKNYEPKFAKGGKVENLKIGDKVYGYYLYNYMGYQLVDERMGGDLTYGEIKDVINENNQKKYVIKFENGETEKVSVGIFKEYLFVDKKYAKGGEIESFVYEDVEYPDSKTEIEDDEIEDFIEDWNERMETNYSSWEDFNKGEKYYKLRPIKEYSQGGMVDLFEDYTKIPRVVQRILDKHSEAFEDGGYDRLQKVIEEVEAVGYTFDYGMDGQAYGLRPIGVDITELSGYEEFAKGGITDKEALHFENGGMPKGISVADANPYIAGAKAVQGIAPQSVSALDQRLASKLNPDPNRPVFF